VSFAQQLSSDEDDEDDGDISWMGGHQWVGSGGGGEIGRLGVVDRDREVFNPGRLKPFGSGELRFLDGE